jgi:ubiquinol-cytochrome c reductase cytochrome c subunit
VKAFFATAMMVAGFQNPGAAATDGMPTPPFLANQSAAVQKGYELFVGKGCYLCHGRVGQGTPMAGPPLAAGAPYEYLLQFTRKPMNIMPPYFPEALSNDEVKSISLYLQAVPKDQRPEDIPALRKIAAP